MFAYDVSTLDQCCVLIVRRRNNHTKLKRVVHAWNRQLNSTCKSAKLVIGRHLLLVPVETAVKPANSVFAHHPKTDSRGGLQCCQLYHMSML